MALFCSLIHTSTAAIRGSCMRTTIGWLEPVVFGRPIFLALDFLMPRLPIGEMVSRTRAAILPPAGGSAMLTSIKKRRP